MSDELSVVRLNGMVDASIPLAYGSVRVQKYHRSGVVDLTFFSPSDEWGWKTQLSREQVEILKGILFE